MLLGAICRYFFFSLYFNILLVILGLSTTLVGSLNSGCSSPCELLFCCLGSFLLTRMLTMFEERCLFELFERRPSAGVGPPNLNSFFSSSLQRLFNSLISWMQLFSLLFWVGCCVGCFGWKVSTAFGGSTVPRLEMFGFDKF